MSDRPHSVKDGVIKRLSVSQIEKFDERTTWGCERRWWFRYVQRLPEPSTGAQGLGTEIHAQIAHYLTTGQDVLGPYARAGKHALPAPGQDLMVEHAFTGTELTARGIPLIGFIDLVNPREGVEIVDWKSTSSIAKYAKTGKQLRDSTQMLGYATWAFNRWPALSEVRLTHGYFQTQGPKLFETVTCNSDRESVMLGWQQVEATVARMVETALVTDSQEVKPNWNACKVGRNWCPYLSLCPRANPLLSLIAEPTKGKSEMGSLLDRFSVAPAAVLAPDAPKSDPALAADPVPGLEGLAAREAGQLVLTPAPPDEAPKKPRGRPRKAVIVDNSTTPDPVAHADSPTVVAPIKPLTLIVTTSVTIRHGAKINMGNYQSANVEVEMSANVNGDIEVAREQLSLKVREALAKEAAVYAAPKAV